MEIGPREPSKLVDIEEKSKNILSMLETWRKRAKDVSLMHFYSYRYFKALNYVFLISIILCGSVAGSLQIADSSRNIEHATCPRTGANYLQMGLGVLTLAAAALTTIHNYTGFALRFERHAFFDDEYEKLSRDIQVHSLLSDTQNRVYTDKGVLLKEIKDKFDRLTEKAPKIPLHIQKDVASKRNKSPQRLKISFQ